MWKQSKLKIHRTRHFNINCIKINEPLSFFVVSTLHVKAIVTIWPAKNCVFKKNKLSLRLSWIGTVLVCAADDDDDDDLLYRPPCHHHFYLRNIILLFQPNQNQLGQEDALVNIAEGLICPGVHLVLYCICSSVCVLPSSSSSSKRYTPANAS